MQTKLSHWGNSLAVRLPQSVLKQAGLRQGDSLEVSCDGQIIQLKPKINRLDQLLEGVTPGTFTEEDWGEDAGAEAVD